MNFTTFGALAALLIPWVDPQFETYEDAIPARARVVRGSNWRNYPQRATRWWNDREGVTYCDDPDCPSCQSFVYPSRPFQIPDFPFQPLPK